MIERNFNSIRLPNIILIAKYYVIPFRQGEQRLERFDITEIIITVIIPIGVFRYMRLDKPL